MFLLLDVAWRSTRSCRGTWCSGRIWFGHFLPDPETYLGVAKMMDLAPDQVMMAAAHNADLGNAPGSAASADGVLLRGQMSPGRIRKRDYLKADQEWGYRRADGY